MGDDYFLPGMVVGMLIAITVFVFIVPRPYDMYREGYCKALKAEVVGDHCQQAVTDSTYRIVNIPERD